MDLRAATGRARTAVCREHPALPGAEHQRVDEQPVFVLLQVVDRSGDIAPKHVGADPLQTGNVPVTTYTDRHAKSKDLPVGYDRP